MESQQEQTRREIRALERFAAGEDPDYCEVIYVWRGFEPLGVEQLWARDEIGKIEKLYILDGTVVYGEFLVDIFASTDREHEIFINEA